MHGRVRVRTSQELSEIQEKEKKKKAEWIESTTSLIFKKREKKEYDEELMNLTYGILSKNPDFTTLWNIRREVMLEHKKTHDESTVNSAIQDELKLTEIGLLQNPKSYGTWYYRCWILENIATDPDWKHELHLTVKFLEVDERNFHCWDYRYFVLSHLNVTYEDELAFITRKIQENMSNYSAWHYRSKLLPLIYSDPEKKRLFRKDIFADEISLVVNAVFTDPFDQSAWFYHDWLLNGFIEPMNIVHAAYDSSAHFVWIAFTKAVSCLDNIYTIKGLGEGEWKPYGRNKKSDHIWGKNVYLEEIGDVQRTISLLANETEIDVARLNERKELNLRPILDDSDREILTDLLKSLKQLLKMEPNCKWTMLGIVTLSEKLNKDIDFSLLEKLKESDKLRKSYYEDLLSRYKVEKELCEVDDWCGRMDLSKASLTWLHRSYYFSSFKEIDLSNNPLGNHIVPQLKYFISCQILNLSNCQITELTQFEPMKRLRELNLSKNKITDCKCEQALLSCTSLTNLYLVDTSIAVDSILCTTLRENNPALMILL